MGICMVSPCSPTVDPSPRVVPMKTGGRKTGRVGDVGKSSKRTGGRKTSSDADAGKSSKRTGGKPPIWRRGGAGKDASEKEFGGNNVATYDYDYDCIEAPYRFSVPGLEIDLIPKNVVTARNEARSIYYNGGLHKIVHLHMPPTGVWCITVEDLVSGDVAKLNLKDKSPTWTNCLVLVAVDEADVMAFVELMKSG
ncbi:hypothetical protein LIER_33356 [Lithospermum erythrorhizon]|uniref:Uncharacterized protein n=1 Tax=Lithospermum erythrorhizon TaxID=34254 RepID=A0AAV3RY76_LITER